MSDNGMDHFKQTFITECYELLEDMEQHLLSLDEHHIDLEKINAIFRCAHSIKGGAGAFSFTRLSDVTHALETLLDVFREGKASVSRHTIDLLLSSVDILKQLVDAAHSNTILAEDFGKVVVDELTLLEQSLHRDGKAHLPSASTPDIAPPSHDEQRLYTIDFAPHKTLFMTGNEPTLILRELSGLGDVNIKANYDAIPIMNELHEEECYITWNISLDARSDETAIREVFEFVEDECDLAIDCIGGINQSTPSAPEAKPSASVETSANSQKDDKSTATQTPAISTIRVDIDKVDRLVNMVGELVITQAMIMAQTRLMPEDSYPKLISGIEELSQHSRELQEAVMSVRMQPVKSVFSRMPRLVRDLATKLKKDIRLEMAGENTEVDKTVIEQLSDPLTHMIRNSVDHGIDTPENRIEQGKPPQGVIHLSAEHRGGRIVITVKDDGRGINREKVLSIAKEKGVVSVDANLTDNEIDALIFAPGFSTAAEVSDISGRGVGMDVVRRNIEQMGGVVHINSYKDEGTEFTISLPLTLAILDGMIVRIGSEHYIIPINSIIETMRPTEENLRKVTDDHDLINVRGEYISLFYLHALFNIPSAESDPFKGLVVLVENGTEKFGLFVDELIGQQQVVIKSLEENADPSSGISGATILGDGKVSLIIDVSRVCMNTPTSPYEDKRITIDELSEA